MTSQLESLKLAQNALLATEYWQEINEIWQLENAKSNSNGGILNLDRVKTRIFAFEQGYSEVLEDAELKKEIKDHTKYLLKIIENAFETRNRQFARDQVTNNIALEFKLLKLHQNYSYERIENLTTKIEHAFKQKLLSDYERSALISQLIYFDDIRKLRISNGELLNIDRITEIERDKLSGIEFISFLAEESDQKRSLTQSNSVKIALSSAAKKSVLIKLTSGQLISEEEQDQISISLLQDPAISLAEAASANRILTSCLALAEADVEVITSANYGNKRLNRIREEFKATFLGTNAIAQELSGLGNNLPLFLTKGFNPSELSEFIIEFYNFYNNFKLKTPADFLFNYYGIDKIDWGNPVLGLNTRLNLLQEILPDKDIAQTLTNTETNELIEYYSIQDPAGKIKFSLKLADYHKYLYPTLAAQAPTIAFAIGAAIQNKHLSGFIKGDSEVNDEKTKPNYNFITELIDNNNSSDYLVLKAGAIGLYSFYRINQEDQDEELAKHAIKLGQNILNSIK